MKVYRNPMEKILDQQENDTIITNSKEPLRTLLRKCVYVFSRWVERAKTLFRLHPSPRP